MFWSNDRGREVVCFQTFGRENWVKNRFVEEKSDCDCSWSPEIVVPNKDEEMDAKSGHQKKETKANPERRKEEQEEGEEGRGNGRREEERR
jgi:hypothetical protein